MGWSDAFSSEPFCIGGDFNKIMSPNERVGCQMLSRGAHDFLDCVSRAGLEDHRWIGPAYTWTNNGEASQFWASRLDRVLVNGEWMVQLVIPLLLLDLRGLLIMLHFF